VSARTIRDAIKEAADYLDDYGSPQSAAFLASKLRESGKLAMRLAEERNTLRAENARLREALAALVSGIDYEWEHGYFDQKARELVDTAHDKARAALKGGE
jgi:hypothetical protein